MRNPTAHDHAHSGGCNYQQGISTTSRNRCTALRHGSASAYRRGCRCDTARRAVSHYEKQRLADRLNGKPRTLRNTGALRRLHALRALGYTSRDLAGRIGVDERNIARWPHRNWISRQHHDAVCRVYAALADTAGPDERARRHAARQGWLTPLWWDDDTIDGPSHDPMTQHIKTFTDPIAIDRYLAGDTTIQLTRAEKHEAFHRLRTAGHSVTAAATQLRLSGYTARRYEADRAQLIVLAAPDNAGDDNLEEMAG